MKEIKVTDELSVELNDDPDSPQYVTFSVSYIGPEYDIKEWVVVELVDEEELRKLDNLIIELCKYRNIYTGSPRENV